MLKNKKKSTKIIKRYSKNNKKGSGCYSSSKDKKKSKQHDIWVNDGPSITINLRIIANEVVPNMKVQLKQRLTIGRGIMLAFQHIECKYTYRTSVKQSDIEINIAGNNLSKDKTFEEEGIGNDATLTIKIINHDDVKERWEKERRRAEKLKSERLTREYDRRKRVSRKYYGDVHHWRDDIVRYPDDPFADL